MVVFLFSRFRVRASRYAGRLGVWYVLTVFR